MLRERAEEFLKVYHPRKLTYKERLRLLEDLEHQLKGEEAPLRSFEGRFQKLLQQISKAGIEQLKELHDEIGHMAIEAFRESRSVREVHALCTEGRDAIARRVLELVEEEMDAEGWGGPPGPYAWMSMGSSGREEETLYTDQDNLLVYDDDPQRIRGIMERDELLRRCLLKMTGAVRPLTEDDVIGEYYEIFSSKVVHKLEKVGIERCRGGVMPVNEKWRASIKGWKDRILGKVRLGKGPLSVLDLIILMDLRPVGGELKLGEELVGFALTHLVENRDLVNEMMSSALLIPLPLGLFRRFITEKTGPHKGKINLKLGGWAPLVLVVRVMARTYGIRDNNTFKRIEALREREVLSPEFASELSEAFYVLMRLRISRQGELLERKDGEDPNYIAPYDLPLEEQKELKHALKVVEELQKKANEIYFGGGFWG
ncbi:MAG: hypothetical protein DRG33_02920 [Deltaproteobacteria bacterium]|nr:MAG: hypothetical protein DRG33_02920 [Deltaproteobacteria bacterium]HEX16518.1 hypothetical protein [Deltaproteobacteria bacterium]